MVSCNFKEAVAESKVTKSFYWVVIIMCLCNSFVGAYFAGAMNSPRVAIAAQINETYTKRGTPFGPSSYATYEMIANLLLFVGSGIGSVATGYIIAKTGSKAVVWYSSFFSLAASILCALTYFVPELQWVGKLFGGIGFGMTNVAVSTYLVEISPMMMRGFILCALPLGMVFGFVLAQVVGLPILLGTSQLWPYMFVICAVLSAISAIALPFFPESYRFYYLTKRDDEAARKSVVELRQACKVEEEMRNLEVERQFSTGQKTVSIKQLFQVKTMRNAFFLSLVFQLAQQMAGSTAVFIYCERIFVNAGVSPSFAPYAVLLTGIVTLIVVVPSIIMVERVGRRAVLFGSLVPTFFLLIGLTLTIHYQDAGPALPVLSIIFVLLFCATFAFGLSSLPSVVPTELFCQEARGKAFALARALNNITEIIQGALFVEMMNAMQEYVFLFFSGIMLTCLIYFFLCLPETKGKTFQQIQAELANTVILCRRKNDADTDEKANELTDIGIDNPLAVSSPAFDSESKPDLPPSESASASPPDTPRSRKSIPEPPPTVAIEGLDD